MQIPASLESFSFSGERLEALVPSPSWIQEQYQLSKASGKHPVFPYWAQVWPAAKALCEMIAGQPELVHDKKVLELAAGVGLPSLLASRFAKSITASDYIPEAVQIIQRSVILNKISNLQTAVLNWNDLNDTIDAEVLLLSDINYDPGSFDALYNLLQRFIRQGTVILLSTPQRLAGKSFMENLEPWSSYKVEIPVLHNDKNIYISVWKLEQ